MVYSIRAIRIRTIPGWMVPEKKFFLKPSIEKIFFALAGKLLEFLLLIDVFSQFRTTEKSGGKN